MTTTPKRLMLAGFVLLPLLGLGWSWSDTHRKAQLGTDWQVKVSGYDPRDLLRGHYISYRYEWPLLATEKSEDGETVFDNSWIDRLCLKGKAPMISSANKLDQDEQPSDCAGIVKAQFVTHEAINGLQSGMIYVPQAKAAEYERNMRDPRLQPMLTFRLRNDGMLTPKALTFVPKGPQTEQ